MMRLLRWFLLSSVLSIPLGAWAGSSTVSVQDRQYSLHHEVGVGAVLLPQNAFYKAVGVDLSYTLHLSNAFAWEPIRASITTSWETQLRKNLIEDFGAQPNDFEVILQQYSTQMHFKPFYGKFSVLNRGLVRAELYFLAGAGLAFTTMRLRAYVDVGVGIRVHLAKNWSLRTELLEQVLMGAPANGNLAVHLGVSRNFR